MKKIVGLGANVLDTLISCACFPKEDTKMRAEKISVIGGGPVGNAMVVTSKLGLDTEMLGVFSDDTSGKRILDELARFGIKTDRTTIVPNTTAFVSYIALSEESGSRTCVFHRGTVPDAPELIALSAIDEASILHLDGNYIKCAVAAAKYAKEKGVKVSLDAGGLYEGIEELLPLVDILIPSAEFAMGITGAKDPATALLQLQEKYAPEILVVTDGDKGGYYYENRQALHYDSVKIRPVDTNGAGDTFHGAFLAAYSNGMSLVECCRFAGAVAAYKCTQFGAREYELNMDLAMSFMKKSYPQN